MEEKIPVGVLAIDTRPDSSHAEWIRPPNADVQILLMDTTLTISGRTQHAYNLTPEKLKKIEEQALKGMKALREALAILITK